MFSKKVFVWYWLPVILYAILIFTLSSLPVRLPSPSFGSFDKLLHFIGYGFYAWLWYRAMRSGSLFSSPAGAAIATVLICSTIGGIDEIYQGFYAYRDSDLYDVLADGAGALVIASFAFIRERYP